MTILYFVPILISASDISASTMLSSPFLPTTCRMSSQGRRIQCARFLSFIMFLHELPQSCKRPTSVPLSSFFFIPLLFASYRVIGMTDDLPTPCRPVHILACYQSSKLFMSLWHMSFYLVFGHHLFHFPGVSVLNTSLSVCSSSLHLWLRSSFVILAVLHQSHIQLSSLSTHCYLE